MVQKIPQCMVILKMQKSKQYIRRQNDQRTDWLSMKRIYNYIQEQNILNYLHRDLTKKVLS